MSTIDPAECPHEHTVDRLDDVPGPHHGRRVCVDCGKHLRWLPAPMTPARAAAFRVPKAFRGCKHRGKTLAEIGQQDRGWLVWAASTWGESHPKIARMIRAFLESTDGANP